jgi:hypothetical protein
VESEDKTYGHAHEGLILLCSHCDRMRDLARQECRMEGEWREMVDGEEEGEGF